MQKELTYIVRGYGNYSHDFDWDNGISFSEPELTEEKLDVCNFYCGLFRDIECLENREYNGSRSVELRIEAYSKDHAMYLAKIWGDYYCPEH